MRIVKISLIAIGAFLALAIAAIAYVTATFDPNDYKGFVTDTFASRTGRTLAIDEDLRLAYFPWLAVETGGVTIGGAPGFGDAPFATVNRVAARVKLLPLLERRVEIGTVELTGFTLNLARDAELRGNWEDLVAALNGGPTEAAPAEPGAAAVESLAIEGVRIDEGNVYWRENVSELRYSVTGLSLATGGIGSGEPVEFEAALQFKDELSALAAALEASAVVAIDADGSVVATGVNTEVTVTPSGAAPRTLAATADRIAFDKAAETLAVDGLATETAGVAATWQIAGSALLGNPRIEGSVAAPSADLAAVLAALEIAPPAGLDSRALGSAALDARFYFQAEPQVVTLTAVEVQALGATVRGNGTLTEGNELSGSIEIPEFAPNAALQSWLRSTVPATIDVSAVERLALRTRFETTLESGRVSLRDLEANVLGATITGSVETVPGARGNLVRGTVATSRFEADAFAKAFAASLPPNLAASELGTIDLDARFEFDQAADTLSVAPFAAELFGLAATGEVVGRNVSQTAEWSGTAKVAQFSPQALLQRFGLPPQPTSDSQALTRATIDTRFEVTGERAELSNVVLALDDTRITGSFTLVGFDAPAYRFALDVDRVNADRYLPPKARDAQEGEATAGDIELPQNNTMDLDGTMRIGALGLAGMQFQEVATRVLIGGGDAKLENARAKLYGGTFDGSFHVRAAGNEPGLALEGRAAGLALEPLITALTGEPANFSGTGSFDLNLSGTGRTVIENVRTAGGNVSFDMSGGVIKGFNLGHALCSAYNVTQRAPAPPDQPAETAYDGIKGAAVVAAGTADSRDLIARTSFMDLTAAGTLKLVEQQLDYRADARLTNAIPIPGCETLDQFVGDALPFNITGTVTAPSITPDFSKLVQRQIREEVQERIQDRIQDRLRDILRDR
jgi:AsmA protein